MTKNSLELVVATVTLAAFGCGGPSSTPDASNAGLGGISNSTGGTANVGGAVSTGAASTGTGGSGRTAGAPSAGGTSASSGGALLAGGAKAAGGADATGGRIQVGGTTAAGGTVAIGGKAASGGGNPTGGSSVTGGTATNGGAVATGGRSATGGTTAKGGTIATGGSSVASGGAATGGSPPTSGAGGLAATPPMGWNSWNTFGCNVTESLIKGIADTFVSSGMKDAGYQYVNIDDCWMNGRDASGKIQVNASTFPSGMAALADYVHSKGLKIGLYSTPGTKTCTAIYSGYTGGVGSLGYETSDAQTYASWGIDYLKYDKCTAALSGFAVMRDALRATGRPIFYSINPGDGTGCVPGKCSLDLPKIANMWRIGFDINASWSSMVGLIDQNAPLYSYAGPGHWNDPDMMEVGKLANDTEDQAHFSMWAIMAAPLIAGNDVRSMKASTKTILTNAEVIAVDQDPLGIQGRVVASPGTNLQVWAKKLSGTDSYAVALFNRGTSAASITAPWSAVGLPAGAATVRNLWTHMDLGSSTDSYTAPSVPGHGVVMLKIVSAQ